MLIVTGTKRSGTSMWMSALGAAGFEPIGKAFPGSWGKTIREANSGGFFESLLRHGVHHGTNPNPETGRYIHHADTKGMAVKIFAGGFVRTHRAFIDHVVMSVRPWREYVRSLTRLYAMEHAAAEERLGGTLTPRVLPRPELEWWFDNFTLLEDLERRQFQSRVVTYDNALSDPSRYVGDVVRQMGGDVDAAIDTIEPKRRTQTSTPSDESSPAVFELSSKATETFDELYGALSECETLPPSLWRQMRKTQQEIAPQFIAGVRAAQADGARWLADVKRVYQENKA